MDNWPVAEPAALGANCTFRFNVWPGFRVTGNVEPDTENPVPLTDAALTVTAEAPLDVRVTVCVA